MMIRKQDNTQPGRRKEQRSSDSTEENGNHTEETQHGPSQSPPNIGVGQENGKKLNKRIQWSRKEMKEVLWCFTYIKEKTLRENYKEAYKVWKERNPMTRMNVDAKALLNQNDEIKENIRLKIGDDTEDYTNGVSGDKIDTNVIEHRKRDQKNDRITNTQVLKESSTQLRIS